MRERNALKRICIDLDGVICTIKGQFETYEDVQLMPGAIESLDNMKKNGYYIIINTARHMKSTESNLGLLNARVVETTLRWLRDKKVPYDEIYFGKPWADFYIDDKAIKFNSWNEISRVINE